MALVSVIIPAFNAQNTISRTIYSVLNQSFEDIEIIVINDGSTDETLKVLNSIRDTRLKVITCINGERANARNLGIREASGEFISFIDADDIWSSNKIESQLEALKKCSDAGVAYSWTTFIDENENILYHAKPNSFQGNVYPNLLVCNFLISGSNILVRKEIIDRVGEFDSSVIPSEDWDYSIRLAAQCEFILVPEYQILYRRSRTSSTKNVPVMERSTLAVIEKAFQSAPVELHGLKPKALSSAYKFIAKIYLELSDEKNVFFLVRENLWKSISLHPRIIFESEMQRLILKVLILSFVPNKIASRLIKVIGRNLPEVKAHPL
jgi:glycosyltransferase involved in cell wall biosynthesis